MKNNIPALIKEFTGKEAKDNRWLTGTDVKNMLQISESTLRRLRQSTAIPYTKLGKSFYYPSLFFEQMLLQNSTAKLQ